MIIAMRWVQALIGGACAVCLTATAALADVCARLDAAPRSPQAQHERVRVIVRSAEHVSISSEVNARIIQMPRREGDHFKRGDVLIVFDCSRTLAERDVGVASHKAAHAAHQALLALDRYKAASTLDVDKSRYEMEKAEAELRVIDARLALCTIRAPFSGRVVEKLAQANEVAQPNQPLVKLIDEDRLELLLMVPSDVVHAVAPGTRFPVCIDETRETHAARVEQSTGLIDPVSQSVRMIGEFEARPAGVLPGMSGTGILHLRNRAR